MKIESHYSACRRCKGPFVGQNPPQSAWQPQLSDQIWATGNLIFCADCFCREALGIARQSVPRACFQDERKWRERVNVSHLGIPFAAVENCASANFCPDFTMNRSFGPETRVNVRFPLERLKFVRLC